MNTCINTPWGTADSREELIVKGISRMKTIKYNKNLVITNVNQLPHGTGAKYLECLIDNAHGVLIAKQWRNKLTTLDKYHALVEF